MAAARIELKTLLLTLLVITTVEFMSAGVMLLGASNPLVVTGVDRFLELLLMMAILVYSDQGLAAVGLSTATAARGFSKGLIWAAGFGGVVAGVGLVVSLWGINPMQLIRIPLPSDPSETLQLFLIGGLVGPVTEELFFRGILYGYFRRWGIFPALFLSTLFFVLLHPVKALAVTQTVGGVLFAAAYEIEGNLLVPITIHVLGNLAIFSLPFLV
ncbi:MAG: type II CAAX endopeptidase family protein [Desulfobacterales bacterium]